MKQAVALTKSNACMVCAVAVLATGLISWAWAVPDPRVVDPSAVDADRDRISDYLEPKVAARTMATVQVAGSTMADLIVCLDHAPGAAEVGAIQSLGGDVPDGWQDLVYAIHARVPIIAGQARELLEAIKRVLPGVVLIEENARAKLLLYASTQQSGARRAWATGYQGAASTTIAIMDTGITSSHADFPSGKIVAWNDQTGDAPTPADRIEHGTHVAGIAAGEGWAAGLASGTGAVYLSEDYFFGPNAYDTIQHYFPIDTRGYGANATINSRLKWIDNAGGSYTIWHRISDSSFNVLTTVNRANTGAQPLIASYSGTASAPGIMDHRYFAWPQCNIANPSSPTWVLTEAPMSAIGDGFRLLSGVAPGCKLAGVKIFRDSDGYADTSWILNGLSWLVSNKTTYNIKVVNMSFGYSSIVSSVDTAVNNAAGAGLVMVAAAGNGRGDFAPYVYSPASASRCIAVAAISHLDQITYYSSYGASGTKKPDVAAPGGTYTSGVERPILAPDSSDGENNYSPWLGTEELYPEAWAEDDYTPMQGTSMACPHVAGQAGLMIEALGSWGWTLDEVLRIKAVIGMTATETNQAAEAPPNPSLNRGDKDRSEGYGRVNMDAAIEALTLSHAIGGSPGSDTLSAGTGGDNRVFNKKCWARQVSLSQDTAYQFDLVVPDGCDFDLYLYQATYTNDGSTSNGSVGDPVIAAKSVSATLGADEKINYSCCATGTYYIVVKWVQGSGTFTLTSQSYVFADVPPGSFAKAPIEAMKANGITGGCGLNGTCADNYCPTWTVTRGQMAVFICRAAGKTWYDPGVATFSDVPRGANGQWDGGGSGGLDADGTHQFYGWIERLAHGPSWPGGVPPTGGCAAGRFCPNDATTRAQMAAFLCRATGKTWLNSDPATFADVPRGSDGLYLTPPFGVVDGDGTHQFYGWIERLADPGSWTTPPTTGCAAGPPRQYCPSDRCTRAQMAYFICRAFDIPF